MQLSRFLEAAGEAPGLAQLHWQPSLEGQGAPCQALSPGVELLLLRDLCSVAAGGRGGGSGFSCAGEVGAGCGEGSRSLEPWQVKWPESSRTQTVLPRNCICDGAVQQPLPPVPFLADRPSACLWQALQAAGLGGARCGQTGTCAASACGWKVMVWAPESCLGVWSWVFWSLQEEPSEQCR